uniref:Uncharacterized protein n=1 Tax=Octopus bimaculoides TaxID=37653 RepID=A0A0L8H5P4_OCTBM
MFEDSEEKQDTKNLYHKLVKLEYAVLTVVCEEVMERFNETSKKLQTPCSDVFVGYLLLPSLLLFVKELRDNSTNRIAHYESVSKRIEEVLNHVYDCLIIQLSKRMGPYEQIAKRFKFLLELMNNSEFDEDSIKLIISHYKDDIDHKLINECYQFKELGNPRTQKKTPNQKCNSQKFFSLFTSND